MRISAILSLVVASNVYGYTGFLEQLFMLAWHTLQQALHYRQAQRHRWRVSCHLFAFSSLREAKKIPGFEGLKAIPFY